MINEAAIPIPSRIILTKNKITKLGLEIIKDIFPESLKSHKRATKAAETFISKCHQTDYRTDSRIIFTEKWGKLLVVFTQYYWYKDLTPEVTTISFNYGDETKIEVYDFIVDSRIFAKEITRKYKVKVAAKTFIPISANNSKEQKEFPRLVELGNLAKRYFNTLPIIQDKAPEGMGNEMSSLYLPDDVKRLYDFQFFQWNQWVEAEYFAKKYFMQGYDVYRGLNSLKDDSIMIYILRNKEPIPMFNKKYFTKAGKGKIPIWGKEEMEKLQKGEYGV